MSPNRNKRIYDPVHNAAKVRGLQRSRFPVTQAVELKRLQYLSESLKVSIDVYMGETMKTLENTHRNILRFI